jgi:hypothetical protein
MQGIDSHTSRATFILVSDKICHRAPFFVTVSIQTRQIMSLLTIFVTIDINCHCRSGRSRVNCAVPMQVFGVKSCVVFRLFVIHFL